MAARRANQVLATVGVFAALVAARMAVESFPASRAAEALAELVIDPPAPAPEAPAPTEEVATKTAAAPDPEPTPRRTPSRAGHDPSRPSVRLIRAPSIPS